MCEILIADASEVFADVLAKRLGQFADVQICRSGEHLLKNIRKLQPDILVIDLMMPGCDPLLLLRGLRTSGSTMQIICTATYTTDAILQDIARLDIAHVYLKPCSVDGLAAFARRLMLKLPELSVWCAETEIDSVLLYLGFQCGRSRYGCIYQGILLKYYGKAGDSVKYLYAEVRRLCGKKNIDVVEKAIRDAIRNAWNNGDPEVWKLYFPTCERTGCPSNEVFLSRIAMALRNRETVRKLYKQASEKIKIG